MTCQDFDSLTSRNVQFWTDAEVAGYYGHALECETCRSKFDDRGGTLEFPNEVFHRLPKAYRDPEILDT